MQLDEQVIAELSGPINKVWDAISDDTIALFEKDGQEITNAECIECCIDASRLMSVARNKTAEKLVEDLVEEHGYVAVLEFLSGHIELLAFD